MLTNKYENLNKSVHQNNFSNETQPKLNSNINYITHVIKKCCNFIVTFFDYILTFLISYISMLKLFLTFIIIISMPIYCIITFIAIIFWIINNNFQLCRTTAIFEYAIMSLISIILFIVCNYFYIMNDFNIKILQIIIFIVLAYGCCVFYYIDCVNNLYDTLLYKCVCTYFISTIIFFITLIVPCKFYFFDNSFFKNILSYF